MIADFFHAITAAKGGVRYRHSLAAKADLLVTGDRPLLSVGEYQGVRIVGMAEALQVLAAKK